MRKRLTYLRFNFKIDILKRPIIGRLLKKY